MRVEIIDRIEKLKKGDIIEGYKKTNIAILPLDWDVKSVGVLVKEEILYRPMDGNHGALHPTTKDYIHFGIPFILASDVENDKINLKECKYIKKEQAEKLQKGFAISGDVLLTHKGSVGNTTVVPNLKTEYIMLTPQVTYYRIKDHSRLNNYYLKSYFQSEIFQKHLKVMSKGATRDYIGIVEQQKLNIIVPRDIVEQQKIATILSAWDKAIELKEKLIEQKKEQKRGLMKALLTGKIRLPGFEGVWKEVRLGDIFERVTRKNTEGNKNILTISAQRGLINQEDFFNKTVASSILDNYHLLLKGEFAYNKSYSNGYPMGAIKRLNIYESGVVTTLYICFRVKKESSTNGDFFEQYFESGLLNKRLTQIAHEGGRAHGLLNVSSKDFFNLTIPIPKVTEQANIARILCIADKEINLLEQELVALKLQKKGLMQLLLTGIVRTVTKEG